MALAGWLPGASASTPESPPEAAPASPSGADVSTTPRASATSAAPASAPRSPEADASDRENEGRAALEEAIGHLQAGEKAEDEDTRRRHYERAIEAAERAVKLLPESADAHFVLFGAKGRIAQMGGLATAALALSSLNSELDEVLRLDPDHSDALAARGGMLMKLPRLMGGDTREGIRYLERAVKINPDGAGTRLELAEAYEILGREADALRAAREAIAIAERKGETEKAERARRFVAELERSCSGCAAAATTD